jgi:hypothetical protein
MIIQGSGSASAAGAMLKTASIHRQNSSASSANIADRVSLSDAAKALMTASGSSTEETGVQNRLDAIKARPAVERTAEDTEYLAQHDERFIEIKGKIAEQGFETLTSGELDYMQKATGMVNTMAYLSAGEKDLYDDLVAKGDTEAAQGLLLIGMSRIGMGGQQVTLPNGLTFDPTNTEVTAGNVRNLFKYLFVDPSGNSDRQFEALASYLERQTSV